MGSGSSKGSDKGPPKEPYDGHRKSMILTYVPKRVKMVNMAKVPKSVFRLACN